MRKCKVLMCEGTSKDKGLSYFRFPKTNLIRRQQWIKFTKQEHFEPTDNDKICSLHFTESDFVERTPSGISDQRKYLKDTAIPTIRRAVKLKEGSPVFCRFCFKEKIQYSTLKETADLLEMELIELLNMFSLSNEYYDTFPKSVCESCFQEISICYDFKQTVLKAEKEMVSYYGTSEYIVEEYIADEYQDSTETPSEQIESIHIETKNTFVSSKLEDENIPEHRQESEENVKMDTETKTEADQSEFFTESESSEDNETGVVSNSKRYVLKTYKCSICNVKFGGKKTYQNHVCDVGVDELTCKQCGKVFTEGKLLRRHIGIHHPTGISTVKKRKCYMCREVLECTRSKFVTHRRTLCPKKGQPIECEICYKTIRTLSGFKVHWLHHKTNNLKYPYVDPRLSAQTGSNLCDHCGFIADSPQEFAKHYEANHQECTFKCSDCPKEFKSKMKVYAHFHAVHKREEVICDICSKVCKNKFSLSDHKRIHRAKDDLNQQKFNCNLCGKNFRRNYFLKVHMNTHTKAIVWDCNCGKSYTTKYQLKQHKMKVHNETM